VSDLQIDGVIGDTDAHLSGRLSLEPLQLELSRATVRIEHTANDDALDLTLSGLDLGPLGEVESATLRIASSVNADGTRLNSARLEASYRWMDLSARLSLAALPQAFPLPPDDGHVTIFLSWEDDGAGGHALVLRFTVEVEDADSLWRFIPVEVRPRVEYFRFAAEIRYSSAAAFAGSGTSSNFEAALSAELGARLPILPAIPGLDLITVSTGGADGLIKARLEGGIPYGEQPYLRILRSTVS
jgi:hypothetical protein